MYNTAIIDRLSNLKYVGKLKHYNASGMSDKKFDENDKVKLFLNISKEGVILNASFKALGCTGVLVSSSFICEMLEDKDVKYARKLDVIAVNRYMGADFSEIKQHAILVVLNALLATLKNYDKSVAAGTIEYYAKLVEKPKKVAKAKTVKAEAKAMKNESNKATESKETITSATESKEETKTESKKETKVVETKAMVLDDTVIVTNEVKPDREPKPTKVKKEKTEKKDSKKEESKAKGGLLNLLSIRKEKSKSKEADVSVSTIEVEDKEAEKIVNADNQISFDFDDIGTEKSTKAKKVKAKKEKVEKSKKDKKKKIVNPLATSFDDEEDTTAPTQEVAIVEAEPVEVEEVVVEEVKPVVTKTVTTKKTTRTTKTVVSKVNESVELEHASHSEDLESIEVHSNDETRKESVAKMNSSLLRLQNLQKSTTKEPVIIEEDATETKTREESLNKLKALVASAKQTKPAPSKPAKAEKPATTKAPKTAKVKEEKKPVTAEKSVKYVKIGEFEERAKKEKKGLFSRIFGRK